MRQIWTPPDHHPEGPEVCDRIHPLPMTRERLGVHAADMGGSTVDALDENPWNSAVLTRLAEACGVHVRCADTSCPSGRPDRRTTNSRTTMPT